MVNRSPSDCRPSALFLCYRARTWLRLSGRSGDVGGSGGGCRTLGRVCEKLPALDLAGKRYSWLACVRSSNLGPLSASTKSHPESHARVSKHCDRRESLALFEPTRGRRKAKHAERPADAHVRGSRPRLRINIRGGSAWPQPERIPHSVPDR